MLKFTTISSYLYFISGLYTYGIISERTLTNLDSPLLVGCHTHWCQVKTCGINIIFIYINYIIWFWHLWHCFILYSVWAVISRNHLYIFGILAAPEKCVEIAASPELVACFTITSNTILPPHNLHSGTFW